MNGRDPEIPTAPSSFGKVNRALHCATKDGIRDGEERFAVRRCQSDQLMPNPLSPGHCIDGIKTLVQSNLRMSRADVNESHIGRSEAASLDASQPFAQKGSSPAVAQEMEWLTVDVVSERRFDRCVGPFTKCRKPIMGDENVDDFAACCSHLVDKTEIRTINFYRPTPNRKEFRERAVRRIWLITSGGSTQHRLCPNRRSVISLGRGTERERQLRLC
jgi:hypothetical protein